MKISWKGQLLYFVGISLAMTGCKDLEKYGQPPPPTACTSMAIIGPTLSLRIDVGDLTGRDLRIVLNGTEVWSSIHINEPVEASAGQILPPIQYAEGELRFWSYEQSVKFMIVELDPATGEDLFPPSEFHFRQKSQPSDCEFSIATSEIQFRYPQSFPYPIVSPADSRIDE